MDTNQSKGNDIDERIKAYHKQEAEQGNQPEAMPTSKEKPAEVSPSVSKPQTTTKEVGPVAKTEEKDPELEEALSNSKNPERTRAYIEKLKAKIRKMEEREKQSQPIPEDSDIGTSVFDILHPERQYGGTQPPVPQASVPQVPMPQVPAVQQPVVQTPYLSAIQTDAIRNQFVMPDGTVDIDGLNRALTEANLRAQQLQQELNKQRQQIATIEINDQLREAYAVYPELDPLNKSNFDKTFYRQVRDRLVSDYAYGRNRRLIEVASEIKRELGQVNQPSRIAEQAVSQYKEAQKARNQGPFEAGRGEAQTSDVSYEELRRRTRMKGEIGDRALTERLKRLGI